jgi:hypothetical protein
VQAAYASAFGKIGFVVAMTAEDQLLSLWRPGFVQTDPRLVVTPSVPEPALAPLLGLAAASLGSIRRRG